MGARKPRVHDANDALRHSPCPIRRIAESRLPTQLADFRVIAYWDMADGLEHLALVLGDMTSPEPVLTRIHSQCLTGDVLGSTRCDCGDQLREAIRQIALERRGVLLYLSQEGRGIGLGNKIRAYAFQDGGLDTVEANLRLGFPAHMRSYSVAAAMLVDLKVTSVRLMTNNPDKIDGIEAAGVTVKERLPLITRPSKENSPYMRAKQAKLGHMLPPIPLIGGYQESGPDAPFS